MTATPNSGYRFDHWVFDPNDNGVDYIFYSPVTLDNLSGIHTMNACFTQVFNINASASSGGFMARQNIFDVHGNLIGWTDDDGHGRTNVFDFHGNLLGWADEREGLRGTFDFHGNMILQTSAPSYLFGRT